MTQRPRNGSPDTLPDHRRCLQLADPDREVEPVGDKVEAPVGKDHFHGDSRVRLAESRDQPGQPQNPQRCRTGHANAALEPARRLSHRIVEVGRGVEHGFGVPEEGLAGFRQPLRARGALDQPDAELLLEPGDPAADHGGRVSREIRSVIRYQNDSL